MTYRVSGGRGRPRRRPRQPAPYTWPTFVVGLALLLLGLAIVAYWVRYVFAGNLAGGVFTVANGNYLAVHIAAEAVAALLAIVGGLGLLAARHWALATALAALGALLYTSINSMAYSLASAPALTPVFGGVLVTVLLSFVALHFGQRR